MPNIALLDSAGVILALLLAAIVFLSAPPSFILLLAVFLIASVAATKYGYSEKRELGLYEHERSWENVLANGVVPAICAIASPVAGVGAYIGSLAAITADKFASELGVLGGEPVSLLNLKPVRRGTSGAVTIFGTLMSFDGALIIGGAAFLFLPGYDFWKILSIGCIGLAGSIGDSILGVLEERGIGNKATTNIFCSLIGAVLGFAFL
jgi:uncharacterized protein (TIGR00297 family)